MENADQIYADENVIITRTLVKFPRASYPINTIASVYVAKPEGKIFLAVVGAIIAIGGLLWFLSGQAPQPTRLAVVAAGAAVIVYGMRRPYSLRLDTSSGSKVAFESRSRAYLHGLRSAIEQAVVARG